MKKNDQRIFSCCKIIIGRKPGQTVSRDTPGLSRILVYILSSDGALGKARQVHSSTQHHAEKNSLGFHRLPGFGSGYLDILLEALLFTRDKKGQHITVSFWFKHKTLNSR